MGQKKKQNYEGEGGILTQDNLNWKDKKKDGMTLICSLPNIFPWSFIKQILFH